MHTHIVIWLLLFLCVFCFFFLTTNTTWTTWNNNILLIAALLCYCIDYILWLLWVLWFVRAPSCSLNYKLWNVPIFLLKCSPNYKRSNVLLINCVKCVMHIKSCSRNLKLCMSKTTNNVKMTKPKPNTRGQTGKPTKKSTGTLLKELPISCIPSWIAL